ncbi:hypothetical protein DL93DRAFT_2227662 [Clavulina sp. PMI_390]|nr:hypothetical protein DL93DRAFT_2227662 [Clavulina sp. PMI_390]
MSSLLLPQRQRLPNETLTSILDQMDPWEVWPLRRCCKNFNSYIMRYLAPRKYLPITSIFIRAEDSWIFVGANRDCVTPSTPGGERTPIPETAFGASPNPPASVGGFAPFGGSSYDHRGRRLAFLSTRMPDLPQPRVGPSAVSQPMADFLPAVDAERDVIQMKLNDPVQVIVRVGVKYFRHLQLSTLVVDRAHDQLVMSVDWRELFNITLHMPEHVRRLKDAQMWPSKLWIPDSTEWYDRPDSDVDSEELERSDMLVPEPGEVQPVDGVVEPAVEPVGRLVTALSDGGELVVPTATEVIPVAASLAPAVFAPFTAADILPPPGFIPSAVPVPAAPLPVFEEYDALEELVEVLPDPEPEHVGFSIDERGLRSRSHSPPPVAAASPTGGYTYGSVSYGEGLTTTEEALREVWTPTYAHALLRDYEDSASEGGHDVLGVLDDGYSGMARSIEMTSDEYAPSLRSVLGSSMALGSHARIAEAGEDARLFLSADVEAPREHDAVAATRTPSPPREFSIRVPTVGLTPPSGSGDEGAVPEHSDSPHGSRKGSEPPHEGESFLLLDDSAEDNSGDSSGAAATAGHRSIEYRSVGVQVHSVMLNASEPLPLTRRHSWPM